MRGVYSIDALEAVARMGSSPHARGLQLEEYMIGNPEGIIPACAGFTIFGTHDIDVRSDHPRMRGVYGPV